MSWWGSNLVSPGLRKGRLFLGLEMEGKTLHFNLCFSVFRDQPNPLTQMCRV